MTYYQIELRRHDVVHADGLPVETYLDAHDRTVFRHVRLAPRHVSDLANRCWEAEGCAELVVAGPRVQALRKRLAMRYPVTVQ